MVASFHTAQGEPGAGLKSGQGFLNRFFLPCFAPIGCLIQKGHGSIRAIRFPLYSSGPLLKNAASRLVSLRRGGCYLLEGHPHPKWDELPLSCTLRVRTANGPHPPNNAAHQNPEMRSVIAKQWSGWLTKRGHWLVKLKGGGLSMPLFLITSTNKSLIRSKAGPS